eukprot:4274570-Pyramimonas_sp.AAC.1
MIRIVKSVRTKQYHDLHPLLPSTMCFIHDYANDFSYTPCENRARAGGSTGVTNVSPLRRSKGSGCDDYVTLAGTGGQIAAPVWAWFMRAIYGSTANKKRAPALKLPPAIDFSVEGGIEKGVEENAA